MPPLDLHGLLVEALRKLLAMLTILTKLVPPQQTESFPYAQSCPWTRRPPLRIAPRAAKGVTSTTILASLGDTVWPASPKARSRATHPPDPDRVWSKKGRTIRRQPSRKTRIEIFDLTPAPDILPNSSTNSLQLVQTVTRRRGIHKHDLPRLRARPP